MKRWYYIAVFILAIALYANTRGHGFVLDDKAIITQNTFTQKGFAGIIDHLTHPYWYGLNAKDGGNYRPISGISFSIERELFGSSAVAGHLLNVLFYALLCVVLLRWLHLLQLMHPALLFIAVLGFAAHPVHTEVVANIKSRDEIYSFLFFLLSAISYWHWLSKRSAGYLVSSCVLLLLSLLSKETSVALLPLYPMMAYRKAPGFVSALKKWTGPLVTLGIYLALYFSVTDVLADKQYHVFDNALVQEAPALHLLATKVFILGEYLRLLVFPHPLRYDYSYNTIPLVSFSNPQVLFTLAVITALMAWCALRFRQQNTDDQKINTDGFALALLVLPLIPVSNLLFPIGSTMAERFLFIPVAGFMVLVIHLAYQLLTKWSNAALAKKVIITTGLAVVLVYGAATVQRNAAWKSEETLFATDLKYLRNNAKAHHNLANIYHGKGDRATDQGAKVTYYESAIPLLERAVDIYPVQEFYRQLGDLYGNLGKWEGVIKTRRAYLEMNPRDATAWMQLGVAEGISGNLENALQALERSYALDPNDANTCNNLGKTYGMLGRQKDALDMFERTLELAPSHIEAKANLELTRANMGQ